MPVPKGVLPLVAALVLAACGGETGDDDGGLVGTCASDAQCDDGRFCNGVEACLPEDSAADASGCVPGTPPCATGTCDEAADTCGGGCEDADGDGASAIACGGTDCDDDDPNRYPGAAEVCDAMSLDEDCDERTFGVRDADGDGAPDALCCNGTNCGDDCDDSRAAVSPLNPETCDGLDNDCDGAIDESVLTTYTVDADGDGFGSDASDAATVEACSAPTGYAENATDCDDDAGGVNPGVPEDCNGGDEDCDGMVDEDCSCVVPSSRACPGAMGACVGGMQTCVDGTWSDCSILPSPETCDGADNDCDGTVDDGVGIPCYADPDRDGYATATATVTMRCACQTDETDLAPTDPASTDCREAPETRAAQTYPGATEECDGIDNDCSSGGGAETDEDADGDGYTSESYGGCAGGPYPPTDCHDFNPDVRPAADYQTSPYCPPGTGILCNCAGTFRCVSSMTGSCTVCTGSSGSAPSFDYDCSGLTSVEPRLSGCSGSCCSPTCGPSAAQGVRNCGVLVPYSCCTASGAGCGSGCSIGSGGNRPLGCR